MENGVDPCYINEKTGESVLMKAADNIMLEELLKTKVDLDHKDNNGLTALARAFKVMDKDVIELLQKAGAKQIKSTEEYYDEYVPPSEDSYEE